MTVRSAAPGIVELDGVCAIEDAETLRQHLLDAPESVVDWSGCTQAHTAVIQILMASKAKLRGSPAGEFLRAHIAPIMKSAQE